ncbi:DUF1656 domain-containing protein [Bradyrhizobium sp. CER78]|uniref:DUF1656 domain-containing protein n=1 Tax=Bradyrhizobium sp. CER78 TaxID=3039162 RepID=UPI0024497B53|nr:DUF1656 domain-containing protein [Bradyrhizobium sp. CER78]MDH2384973.1 DUF1656 domain-containing protein [Bradyrhizobium sp. CER78]
MRYEVDLFGIILPSFLLWGVVAYILMRMASILFVRVGLYRYVWHPELFNFALYICVIASLIFACRELVS